MPTMATEPSMRGAKGVGLIAAGVVVALVVFGKQLTVAGYGFAGLLALMGLFAFRERR